MLIQSNASVDQCLAILNNDNFEVKEGRREVVVLRADADFALQLKISASDAGNGI